MAHSTVTSPRPTSMPAIAHPNSDYFGLQIRSRTSSFSTTPTSSPGSPTVPASPRCSESSFASVNPRTWTYSSRERPSPHTSPRIPTSTVPGRQNPAPLSTITLPLPASASTMGDAVPSQPKQPSLMRRVSQKAANKLRRRTSSTSHDHDERSGPVLMRHRSGSLSTTADAVRLGIQQVDTLEDEDVAVADTLDQVDGEAAKKEANAPSAAQDAPDRIVIPDALEKGTTMLRVTRKKKTQRLFKLDINSAKVSWDPSKQSSRFYVDDIKEIRTGADARNYREEFQISSDCEERWVTIQYADPEDNGKLKSLHLIAPTVELFHQWTLTLERIHRYRTEMMAGLAMQGEKFVDAHWRNYMSSQHAANPQLQAKDERLSLEDVERLCRRLHVNCSRKYLKEKFKRADRDNSGYLNFLEFRRFVKLLKEREEIKAMFKDVVANPDVGMYRHEFRGFLRDVQKVELDADSAYIDKIFRKFCRQSFKSQRNKGALPQSEELHEMRMSQEAFADFLLSSYNPPLISSVADQDLSRPLNEYFISSSHNTYLMGRQVRGESSVEGYIRVLQRGCRCVEIDCWDGDDGRPVVTHGHTGTSQILFSDVISAIAKYAFMASPYPLILSLEVHCCLEQQIKMADILMRIFGDKLIAKPMMSNTFVLPSPEDLKHRVLVKVKGTDKAETLASDTDRRSGSASPATPRTPSSGNVKGLSSSSTNSTTDTDSDSVGLGDQKQPKKKVPTKIAHELGCLGVYCRGQKFRNFALPVIESKTFNHIFSFQEKSFAKFCKDPEKKVALEKHNMRYLMRLYPSGFRVNSSNFDPLAFWRRGVQMVALNWQTYDLGMQMNEAMFASGSDSCGYVLKPKELRGSTSSLDPPVDAVKAKKDKKELKFSIEVISAQQLSRPKDHRVDDPIDPFVEVEVFSADDKMKGGSTSEGGLDTSSSKGTSGLGAPQKRRTKVVKDDGFHPLFNEKMTFTLVTKFESLVFVRFSIFTADGIDASDPTKSSKQLIATFTAKLISLQQGYRHLPLYDVQGEQFLFSTLFVKINVQPFTVIDRDLPERTSTIESLKTTARSMLIRGRSVRKMKSKRSSSHERSSGASSSKGKGQPQEAGGGKNRNASSSNELVSSILPSAPPQTAARQVTSAIVENHPPGRTS